MASVNVRLSTCSGSFRSLATIRALASLTLRKLNRSGMSTVSDREAIVGLPPVTGITPLFTVRRMVLALGGRVNGSEET